MVGLKLLGLRGEVDDGVCSHRGRVMDIERWKSTRYQKYTSYIQALRHDLHRQCLDLSTISWAFLAAHAMRGHDSALAHAILTLHLLRPHGQAPKETASAPPL